MPEERYSDEQIAAAMRESEAKVMKVKGFGYLLLVREPLPADMMAQLADSDMFDAVVTHASPLLRGAISLARSRNEDSAVRRGEDFTNAERVITAFGLPPLPRTKEEAEARRTAGEDGYTP